MENPVSNHGTELERRSSPQPVKSSGDTAVLAHTLIATPLENLRLRNTAKLISDAAYCRQLCTALVPSVLQCGGTALEEAGGSGSRPKKAQSERGFSCFRRWRKSRRHQQLPPPGNIHPQARSSQKSQHNIIELADGFHYTLNLYSGPVHQARNTVHGQSESSSDDIIELLVHETDYKIYKVKAQVHYTDATIQQMCQIFNEDIVEELVTGFTYSTSLVKGKVLQSADTSTFCSKGVAEFSLKLEEACRMRALRGGTLKKLVEFMTPAILGGNISHLSTFGTRHPSFSRAPTLMDDLLTRSCLLPISSGTNKVVRTPEGLPANNDNGHSSRNQIKRAMASTVGTWPDQMQGFGEPLHLSLLHWKQTLVQVNVPTLQQLCQAHRLSVDLEYPGPQNVTPEGLPAELRPTAQLPEGPAEGLVPFSARGLALARPGMKQHQEPGCRRLCNEHIPKKLFNECNYSTSLDKWKIHDANESRGFCSEVRASPDGSPYL
nr:uncharacterized protein LOC123478461 [Desmodus rotundus]